VLSTSCLSNQACSPQVAFPTKCFFHNAYSLGVFVLIGITHSKFTQEGKESIALFIAVLFLFFVLLGRYVYIIDEGHNQGTSANLIFYPFLGSRCFVFYYYLVGGPQTQLTLRVGDKEVFKMNSNQGNEWKKAVINVTGMIGKVYNNCS
jgi:hypothetical protein